MSKIQNLFLISIYFWKNHIRLCNCPTHNKFQNNKQYIMILNVNTEPRKAAPFVSLMYNH